ncbi:hypothetical protein WJX81_000092 [Elliptochloris bilobata]|uniref:CHRD domain-containing protein n=1 Tax=Elliptochloris bilobata TaxID=381761 RepID=A0AAW1QKH8_9CHLO
MRTFLQGSARRLQRPLGSSPPPLHTLAESPPMAAAATWLVCAALALCACSAHAHTHSAPRLAAAAGAAPDATTTSKATGVFFVDLDDGQGAWNLTLHGVKAADVLAPSIHEAPANGSVGPEVVPLPVNATSTRTEPDGSVLLQGGFTAADYTGPYKGRPFDIVHRDIHQGLMYVVVPTKAHPAGEIKGAINSTMLSE